MHLYLHLKDQVGVITKVAIDPYDEDFRNIDIYVPRLEDRGDKSSHIEHKQVTAREAQEKRLLPEKPVVWGFWRKLHRATQEELDKLQTDEATLLHLYYEWVKLKDHIDNH